MKRTCLLVALLVTAAAASAQQYKWVDRNGRVQYGDTPPPGANATALRSPSGAPAVAPRAPDAKAEARKGPLTPAEQEAAFRKRRQEAEREREKQAKAEQDAQAKKDNCARAQAAARTFEGGQRITRTDANGERRFLDDAEIAREAARARQMVQEWCG